MGRGAVFAVLSLQSPGVHFFHNALFSLTWGEIEILRCRNNHQIVVKALAGPVLWPKHLTVIEVKEVISAHFRAWVLVTISANVRGLFDAVGLLDDLGKRHELRHGQVEFCVQGHQGTGHFPRLMPFRRGLTGTLVSAISRP